MGLAASQAHLDLLTLRKSDLEFQVMQISDRRLQLTRDMEALAEEKARKLGNKVIHVINPAEDRDGEEQKLSLSIDNLNEQNRVLIETSTGKVITDKNLTEMDIENGLRNGKYRLAEGSDGKATQDETTDKEDKNKYVDWRTDTAVRDEYYTDDDELATAEYDAATAKIKAKDQEFDMQQKTAETQQKAVTNEIDGVKKNIEKTIEMSFKLFA